MLGPPFLFLQCCQSSWSSPHQCWPLREGIGAVLSPPLQPECLGSGELGGLPHSIHVTILMCILTPPALGFEHGVDGSRAPGAFTQSTSPLESQQRKLAVKESTELAFFPRQRSLYYFYLFSCPSSFNISLHVGNIATGIPN